MALTDFGDRWINGYWSEYYHTASGQRLYEEEEYYR